MAGSVGHVSAGLGAKDTSSMNVLTHQFPPPLLSRHLFQLEGQGIGV